MAEVLNKEKIEEEKKSEQLEYLMRRFGNKVLKLAYYHLRNHHHAEDVVQEVFCRVYKNLDKFRQESSYYTWIYTITLNLCRDYLRSAYFRRILTWGDFRYMDNLKKSEERMFESVEGGEIFQKVMDLPLKYRTVIALHYFDELPINEIAKVLSIKENTVRTRLCRARKMLQDILSKGGGSYGRQKNRRIIKDC